ncbi:MAG: phosphotransferase, partial [Oscillospiraceae bacterium]|nr:phosphotransferase [Oscillospiraceae bacterium]
AIGHNGEGQFRSWSEALLDVSDDRPDKLTNGWMNILLRMPEVKYEYDGFYERLKGLVKYCPEQKRLIHSDLLYQNLLVDDGNVSAVLDWGCAMVGDPAYDLAIFVFFEPWYPAFSVVGLIGEMRRSFLGQSLVNGRNLRQRIAAYQIHLTLANVAYCLCSSGKHDHNVHIKRMGDILACTDLYQ